MYRLSKGHSHRKYLFTNFNTKGHFPTFMFWLLPHSVKVSCEWFDIYLTNASPVQPHAQGQSVYWAWTVDNTSHFYTGPSVIFADCRFSSMGKSYWAAVILQSWITWEYSVNSKQTNEKKQNKNLHTWVGIIMIPLFLAVFFVHRRQRAHKCFLN